MNEPLGLIEEMRERRERLLNGLSATARHRVLPTLYARPLPSADPLGMARAEVGRLTAEIAALKDTVSRLRDDRRALATQVDELIKSGRAIAIAPTRRIPITEVQLTFCEMFNEIAGANGARPVTVADLCCQSKIQPLAWPRMVCMDLTRRLCVASYPIIGRAFGGRDHTSIINAIRRTPYILSRNPDLAVAHRQVLATMAAP